MTYGLKLSVFTFNNFNIFGLVKGSSNFKVVFGSKLHVNPSKINQSAINVSRKVILKLRFDVCNNLLKLDLKV